MQSKAWRTWRQRLVIVAASRENVRRAIGHWQRAAVSAAFSQWQHECALLRGRTKAAQVLAGRLLHGLLVRPPDLATA